MSFFEKSAAGELPPPGTYYAKLADLKIETQDDYNDPTQKVQRVKWVWETTSFRKTDSKPVLIFDWTGSRYGNPKANLTKRLVALFPKLTDDQRAELAPPQLLNMFVQIELVRELNDKKEEKNTIALIKRVKELPESTWLPDEDEDEEEAQLGSPTPPDASFPASAAPSPMQGVSPPAVTAPVQAAPSAYPSPPVAGIPGDPFADTDPATPAQLEAINALCTRTARNAELMAVRYFNANLSALSTEQASAFIVNLQREDAQTVAAVRG